MLLKKCKNIITAFYYRLFVRHEKIAKHKGHFRRFFGEEGVGGL